MPGEVIIQSVDSFARCFIIPGIIYRIFCHLEFVAFELKVKTLRESSLWRTAGPVQNCLPLKPTRLDTSLSPAPNIDTGAQPSKTYPAPTIATDGLTLS